MIRVSHSQLFIPASRLGRIPIMGIVTGRKQSTISMQARRGGADGLPGFPMASKHDSSMITDCECSPPMFVLCFHLEPGRLGMALEGGMKWREGDLAHDQIWTCTHKASSCIRQGKLSQHK